MFDGGLGTGFLTDDSRGAPAGGIGSGHDWLRKPMSSISAATVVACICSLYIFRAAGSSYVGKSVEAQWVVARFY